MNDPSSPLDQLAALGPLALGSRVKRLGDAILAQAQAALDAEGHTGLTPSQVIALMTLAARPGLSVTALAAGLGVSQPAVTRTIAALREAGLLARGRALSLSAQGAALHAQLRQSFMPRIGQAAAALYDGVDGDFLAQIAVVEARLAAQPLAQRMAVSPPAPAAAPDQAGPIVRAYRPDDAGAFRALNEEWIAAFFTLEDKDREALSDPQGSILDQGGAILIAELASRQVGCVALIPCDEGEVELAKMAVAPGLRGQRLGHALMEAALAEARAMGAQSVYLESNRSLAPAIALYRSAGFRELAPDEAPPSPYARCDIQMRLVL